jgi:hypothetical protein
MPFSRILKLLMGFTLPIIDTISMKDFSNLVASLNFGAVADKLVRSSPMMDLIFKRVNQLLISFHSIDVSKECIIINKQLCGCGTGINCGCIRVHDIHGNRLIVVMDI